MNYFELYPGDYLRDTTRLTLIEHGAYLRLLMAYYAEEQPLPADFSELFVIAGAVNLADRNAVKKVAEKFFPVGEDGMRHNSRADEELTKAAGRMEGAKERRENENDRQKRTRARRTKLFLDLREVGIVPDALITMADLKALHAERVTRDMSVTEAILSRVTGPEDVTPVTPVITPVNTATRPQTPDPIDFSERSPRAEGSLGAAPALAGTPAGQAAAALNRAGLRITSHNPNLLAACAEGVSVELLLEVHALYPDKGAGYVIQAARGIRAERAQSLTNGETHGADSRGAGPRRESLSDRTKRLNAEHDARESDPGF